MGSPRRTGCGRLVLLGEDDAEPHPQAPTRREDENNIGMDIWVYDIFTEAMAVCLPSYLRHDIYGMRFRETIPRLQRHDYVL